MCYMIRNLLLLVDALNPPTKILFSDEEEENDIFI